MAGVINELDLMTTLASFESGTIDFGPFFKRVRLLLVSDAKKNFRDSKAPDGTPWLSLKHPRARGGDRPLRDRGFLMASLTSQGDANHVEKEERLRLTWGTNLPYAAIHQYGGTIFPKKGKMLSIPLTKEAARAGSARDFPRPLFVFQRSGKPPLLAEYQGRGKSSTKQKLVFQFALAPYVKIPARPFIGFNDQLMDDIGMALADYVAKQLGAT